MITSVLLILAGWLALAYVAGFVVAAFQADEPARRALRRAVLAARAWRDEAADELAYRIVRRATRRPPDFIIGTPDRPYLKRWWLLPRNPVLNVYLHHFLRDDDDRALHDHPWDWCSILLNGSYTEHTIDAGGIHRRRSRRAGSVKLSRAERAHRIELPKIEIRGEEFSMAAWTLFITGPRRRAWGFHCPERGWIPWERFCKAGSPGEVGPGCDA